MLVGIQLCTEIAGVLFRCFLLFRVDLVEDCLLLVKFFLPLSDAEQHSVAIEYPLAC
jgi:hypothetical protein